MHVCLEEVMALQTISWVTSSPEPTYEPSATCARCGRRGTVGFVARGSGVLTVEARFCFQCWPTAHREITAARKAEGDAYHEAFAERMASKAVSGGSSDIDLAVPQGMSLQTGWRGLLADLLWIVGALRAPAVGDR
jgi:hypothetical protein